MDFSIFHWAFEGLNRTLQDKFSMSALGVNYLSSAFLFSINIDYSLVLAVLGALGAIASVIKNGLDSYRTYLQIKQDKLKAEHILKEIKEDRANKELEEN